MDFDIKPENLMSADKLLKYVVSNSVDRRTLENALNNFMMVRYHQTSFYKMSLFNEDDSCVIDIRYSNKGNPRDIYLSNSDYETDLIELVSEEIQKSKITGSRIIRRLSFSTMRVEKQIRYNDDFQILPMIPGNPIHDTNNPGAINPKHPFILELKVHIGDDNRYNAYYSNKAINETELLLNAITKGVVRGESKFVKADWLTPYESEPVFKQLGYFYTFPKNLPDNDFSNNEQIPFEYKRSDRELFEPLSWGEAEYTNLKLFHNLNAVEKKQFMIAAYWIRHATLTQLQSGSSSYIAIVSAFESLSGVDEKQDKCSECKQIKNSTARFKRTVETLLKLEKKDISKLYSLRSQYAHGSDLALMDIEGYFLAHHDHSNEMITLSELIYQSKSALLSWLIPDVRYNI